MMAFIYALNVGLAVLLLFWPVWFSMRRLQLPFVNPYTIVCAIGLPVQVMKLFGGPLALIEEGLSDPGYQMALLMGSLLTLAQTAGLLFFLRCCRIFRIERNLPLQRVTLNRRDLLRAGRFFLIVFALSLYLLASAEFGVVNWLSNPREGYQLYRTGQGHWYALAVSALSVSFTLSFLTRPRPGPVLAQLVLHLALGYLLGSKGTLLAIFTSALVFLWFLRWKHLRSLLVFGTPMVFGLALVNLYLALSDGFDMQAIVEYFDYYKNAADYYSGYLRGEIPLYLGEVTWSSLWAYVPRGLWPDKPVVYGTLLINEIFYPGQAEMTNTPAFGGAVEQFADFGVAGVMLFGFFSAQSIVTALMAHLIFRRPGVRFDRVTLATVLLMLVQYAPAFGAFFPGGLYLALLVAVVAIVRMLRRARRKSRALAAPFTAARQGVTP